MRSVTILILASLALCPFVGPVAQERSLVASVDRAEIHENESFLYRLRASGAFSGRPDLSALTRDFDVLRNVATTSSVQIVNGRTSRVSDWTVELIPRRPGRFELPPVELDGALSNAVSVEILPAEDVDSDADVFIEVELDRNEAYVQSQAVFTLRLFVAVATGREGLAGPAIEGGEAIVESLGQDREYQAVRGDRSYRVRERSYSIFPQAPGTLTIGPVEYQATVVPNLGFQRRQRLLSDTLELTVLPAVAPPDTHPTAIWLPARSVEIEESWGDVSDTFEQGVPRTRELTVLADGVLETQLPELVPPAIPGLRQYADQPELDRHVTANGITAVRTERFAVIASEPGRIELPAVELPWWNVDTERWEIARIEPSTVEVVPGRATESSESESAPIPPPGLPAPPADPGPWPWISAVLALGWIGTLAAWGWTARRGSRPRPTGQRPAGTSTRALIRQIVAACRVDDAERTRDLLLEWAARHFSDDPPTSLGALARRLPAPLRDEILALETALYGPAGQSWRGLKLAECVKSTQSVALSRGEEDRDPLVPLYR